MEGRGVKHIPHLRKKKAKGKTYYYYDLGQLGLKRLPDVRHRDFAAALAAAKAMRTKGERENGTKTFDWLVRLFEKSSEFSNKARNTQRQYSLHLGYANENFRNAKGHSWPLDIIKPEHVQAIRDKYAHKPGTANAIVRAVGALYSWGGKPGRKYVKENIASGIEPLEVGQHEKWPEWLVEAALADPAIRLPVALLYYTGQRIGDVVRMGRPNISRGVLSITQEKTGTSLRIAVHKGLAQIIEADAPKDSLAFLLADRGGPVTESGLRQRIQKWALVNHKQKIVPHGLRRNAVDALLESGCSTAEVSSITGQSLAMIEHYAKGRDTEHLSRAAILKFEARNK